MRRLLRLIPLGIIASITYGIFSYIYPATSQRSTHVETISGTADLQYNVVKIADGLDVPRSIVRTSQSRILVTERAWRIRVIQSGSLQKDALYTVSGISNQAEEGLMSITTDPQYTTNKRIYIAHAYAQGEKMQVKVVRLTDKGTTLDEEKTIIDKLAAATSHAGTALRFWPDGKLYITVGDATQGEKAQFPDYNNGKTLRINADGTIPKDNPFPGYATRSIWHRNSQGIARNSKGELYAVEHGPSIFDGPPWGDEINRIIKWWNYGRPVISHEQSATGMIDPIAIYTPAIAPASLLIYQGDMFPERKDQLFVWMLKGEGMLKVTIDPKQPDTVIDTQKIIDGTYGRIRFVGEWPDGSIYFTTSNEDGRWTKHPEKDTIYRIVRI